jgi:hypothetical protein
MNINPEYESEVRRLLQARARGEAVEYLSRKLNVTVEDAQRLVTAVEHELAAEQQQRLQTAGKFVRGCGSIAFKFLGIGFGFVALSFIAGAIIIYFVESVSNPVSAEGKIVAFQTESERTSPVVEFEWKGEIRTYKATTFTSNSSYTVGQTVPLLVNSENPDEAIIDTFEERWLMIVVVGGIGTFFLFLTIVFFKIGKRIQKPD